MIKKYDHFPNAKNVSNSFARFSQAFSNHQSTMQQLADAFKRFSTLMKGLKRNDRLSDCANKCL